MRRLQIRGQRGGGRGRDCSSSRGQGAEFRSGRGQGAETAVTVQTLVLSDVQKATYCCITARLPNTYCCITCITAPIQI